MSKYFKYDFAVTGDKTAVPNITQFDGSVSYQQGFGFDYQRAKIDPLVKNIPRDQTNQLFADLTGAVKQYQENAFPDWITTADNDGAAYPYRVDDYVRYTDGVVYRSIAAVNTAVPGTDLTKWVPFSFEFNPGVGWFKLPSGIMLQTGVGNCVTGYNENFLFPTPFPISATGVIAGEANAVGWGPPPSPVVSLYGTTGVDRFSFNASCVRFFTGSAIEYNGGGFIFLAWGRWA